MVIDVYIFGPSLTILLLDSEIHPSGLCQMIFYTNPQVVQLKRQIFSSTSTHRQSPPQPSIIPPQNFRQQQCFLLHAKSDPNFKSTNPSTDFCFVLSSFQSALLKDSIIALLVLLHCSPYKAALFRYRYTPLAALPPSSVGDERSRAK